MKRLLPIFILVCGLAIALSVQGAEFNLGFLGAKSGRDADIVGYIDRVYRGSLYVASILAVGMIVVGGLYFSLSGVIDRKSEGKEMIRDAILGLVLLFGATVIFQTVNPNIVKLSPPKLATLTTAYPACSGDQEKEVEFKLDSPQHTWASLDKPPDKDNLDKRWCFTACKTPQTIPCNVAKQEAPTCLTSAPQPFFARLLGSSDDTCEKPSCSICAPIPVAVSCPAALFDEGACDTPLFLEGATTDDCEIFNDVIEDELGDFFDAPVKAAEYCLDGAGIVANFHAHGGSETHTVILKCELLDFKFSPPQFNWYRVRSVICEPSVGKEVAIARYPFYTKGLPASTADCRTWAEYKCIDISENKQECLGWKKKNDYRDNTWVQC